MNIPNALALICTWDTLLALCALRAARSAGVKLAPRAFAVASLACVIGAQCALLITGDGVWTSLATAAACGALGVSAVTDVQTGYAFDAVTLPALAVVVLLAAAHGALATASTGALTCGGLLLALYAVTRGRGLGLGDVKLGVLIGAACGAHTSLAVLFGAFVAGGAYAAFRLLCGANRKDSVAFVPYLATSFGGVLLLWRGVA